MVKLLNLKIKMKNILILGVMLATVGGISFWSGTKYQERKISLSRMEIAGQFGGRAGGERMAGGITRDSLVTGARGGQIEGEIISVDDKSITVKMADNSSKIVLLNDKTNINKASLGQLEDLVVGERVMIFGNTNSDGSVTGQNVQISLRLENMAPDKTGE